MFDSNKMDISRVVAGAILLIIAIHCFMTFPSGLTIDVIVKCVAGVVFTSFGVLLLVCGLKKCTALAILGAILLTFSIFAVISIPDLAVKCIVCGLLIAFGVLLVALGLKCK